MPDVRRRFGVTRKTLDPFRRTRAVALALALCLLALGPAIADQPAPTSPPAVPAPPPPPVKQMPEAKPLFQLFPSDPLDVTTIGGKGSIPFRLRILVEKEPPLTSLTVTVPVGGGRALPDGAATVTADRIETVGEERFHVLTLAVNAPGAITAGTTHKGQILVPGGPHLPFTVTERGGSEIESLTDKVALVLGLYQAPSARVAVRNKGTSAAAISGLSTSLTDAPSGRLLQSAATMMPAPISPGGVSEVDVTVPWPALAGVYAGSLAITAGAQRITVPFSVTTRGPTLGALPLLPFILFIVVFALGARLSYGLEHWFGEGGGLVKAEAVVALARAERGLALLASNHHATVAVRPALNALTAFAAQLERDAAMAADSRLERVAGLPMDLALTKARTAQSAGQLLKDHLDAALPAIAAHAAVMTAVNAGLANLRWPTDQTLLTKFESEARKVFDDAKTQLATLAAVSGQGPKAASAGPAQPFEMPTDPVEGVAMGLDAIERMANLQRGVVILVALLTAYQTFYAPNAAFGRALDYLAVFVWSLGMTQAGTQVLSRARAKTS
jgi:hypothetical protein